MAEVTLGQFRIWLEDPVTKALREELRQEVENLKEQWASGQLMCATPHETFVQEARVLGRVEHCRFLLEWEPEELVKEKDK